MPTISTYFSIAYIVLLMVTVIVCSCTPQKVRRWVLLGASYVFFYSVSGKLLCYLIFSTLSIHHIGLWISQVQEEEKQMLFLLDKEQKKILKAKSIKKQQLIMTFAVILHIGILALLKYTPFAAINLNHVFGLLGIDYTVEIPTFLVPIGISFYTLQAVSYLFDVYRKKISADRNLLRLALFMSFFPQIMEGPICRYNDTAMALWQAERVKYYNFIPGGQRILIGFMKKLVVADRLNLFIQNVFLEYDKYNGFAIALSAVCYTLQLYMDFSGTMDVVIGSAQIFGVSLPENFQRPFFAATISEFWKRWHITLGTWFKDYIFYPMSMSKPLKKLTSRARKKLGNHFGPLVSGSIALFCVWLCNGIWHGAGWNYIFYGMYHFVFILIGNVIQPTVIKTTQRLHINRKCFWYRLMQIVRTFIIVCIGELFFRAEGLKAGLKMFQKMVTDFSFSSIKDGSIFTWGMDKYDYFIIGVFVIGLLVVGILQERGVEIRKAIAGKKIAVQFAVYYALILFVIVFGAYGMGYVPLDPIYANF